MKLWAHRGSHEAPGILENTLAAFEMAIAEGADGIELDVHLSADGIPVVFHDESLERLSMSHDERAIGEVAWGILKDLPLVNGATMPTLGDALDVIGDRLPVNVEIKDPVAVHAVADLLEAGTRSNVFISSFNADAVYEASVRLPHVERAWISGDPKHHPIWAYCNWFPWQVLCRTGATRWHTHGAFVRRGVVRRLASRGIQTHVWTINEAPRALNLQNKGVHGIFTDAPGRLRRELQN
jgi:glycerophosphoryl diester phosphodiesterase